jgi:hypothetical protein
MAQVVPKIIWYPGFSARAAGASRLLRPELRAKIIIGEFGSALDYYFHSTTCLSS